MITSVPGFQASGIAAGVKGGSARDLALLVSEVPATATGVFTTNSVKAAPVIISRKRLRGGVAQALLVNSGNANACTGRPGYVNAETLSRMLARDLAIEESLVLVSSTGIIGIPLPVEKIAAALPSLVSSLSPQGLGDFAEAIMTTDTFPKVVSRKVQLGGKEITLCGIAKGSGMVMPSMATLLSFIITDVAIEPFLLSELFRGAISTTLNSITIDGETSTNDMAIVMANGYAENPELTSESPGYSLFSDALHGLLRELSSLILRDAEGSTKVIQVDVEQARSKEEGKIIAYSVANSMLVKTALFGEDPNWGRIISAIGKTGVAIDPDRIDIFFDDILIVKNSEATGDTARAKDVLRRGEFRITIHLNTGNQSASVATVDLSHEYIRINSAYPT